VEKPFGESVGGASGRSVEVLGSRRANPLWTILTRLFGEQGEKENCGQNEGA